MKQCVRDIFVQADKAMAADLELFSAGESQISDNTSNSNLVPSAAMNDEYKHNRESYFQRISHQAKNLFTSQGSESTMIIGQMFTAQEKRCNFHFDDEIAVLRIVTLCAPSSNNMFSADEVLRIVEQALMGPQKSFPRNINYDSKNKRKQSVSDRDLRNVT